MYIIWATKTASVVCSCLLEMSEGNIDSCNTHTCMVYMYKKINMILSNIRPCLVAFRLTCKQRLSDFDTACGYSNTYMNRHHLSKAK